MGVWQGWVEADRLAKTERRAVGVVPRGGQDAEIQVREPEAPVQLQSTLQVRLRRRLSIQMQFRIAHVGQCLRMLWLCCKLRCKLSRGFFKSLLLPVEVPKAEVCLGWRRG